MPTPNLALVPVAGAQAQKHVTVNEAFARIDAAAQLTAQDRTRTSPAPAPADGDRHLVADGATGDWSTHDGEIAAWDASVSGWIFLAPRDGWQIWITAEQQMLRYDGTIWGSASPAQFGINAAPDAVNRLSVSSEAILLNHDGGSIQTKLNKANDSDTASVLFQSSFTGYAEVGLTGGIDFQIKTSPDGITFTEALTLDATTGEAVFPAPATINGLSVSPDLALNILPDQGRFGGEAVNATHLAPTYVEPTYLRDFNSSTLEAYAPFIHSNTTYGGSAGVLDPEIDALLSLTRDPLRRRYGTEWWAMKITKGSGTSSGVTVGGVIRHPALRAITTPLPCAYTVGFYLRVLSGSAYVDQDLTSRFARWGTDETGNLSAGIIDPSDGWVFIERQMTFNPFGFNAEAIQVYLETPGDEAIFALPRVVVGHMALDPYLPGPLPNARLFG